MAPKHAKTWARKQPQSCRVCRQVASFGKLVWVAATEAPATELLSSRLEFFISMSLRIEANDIVEAVTKQWNEMK